MITLPRLSSNEKEIIRPQWDVQVLKEQKLEPKSDSFIDRIRRGITNSFSGWLFNDTNDIYTQKVSEYPTIADFDSFISFNGSHDAQIVQNAVEQGSFRSVNKIRKPNTFVVELAKGGVQYYVETVLNNFKKYQGSTEIFRIVTPYGNLDNLNLVKLEYGYTRESGAGLLIAKLTFQEIITGSVREDMYSLIKVNNPSKTNTINTGNKALATRSWEKYR